MIGQNSILNRFITTRPLLSLFFIFILVQVFIYCTTGVITNLEAEKYVTEGNSLYDTGSFSASKYIFYLPVILLVYVCRFFGVPVEAVALVQVALAWLALECFYKLSKGLSNKRVAFFTTALLALFIPLQTWNFTLYTDSVFISLSIIYSFIVFKYDSQGVKGSLIIILFLILLIFSRPHGLLFIPPTIIYFLFRKQSRNEKIAGIGLCVLLIGAMYAFLNMAFTGGGDMDAMKPFIEEHIICFVPLKPEGAQLNIVHTASPVNDIFYYIFHNPMHFFRLMGLKLLSFFNITRTYYTTLHNALLAVFIIPVYLFSLAGLVKFPKSFRNFLIFLISLLVLYPLGATFQCDDWHSRFTMVVFPYFILLAGIGVSRIRSSL